VLAAGTAFSRVAYRNQAKGFDPRSGDGARRLGGRFPQEIGEAAHEHAFQAIRSPSATGVDNVLAIFPDNLAGPVLDVRLLGEWGTASDLAGL
jgi:hypothetical protein